MASVNLHQAVQNPGPAIFPDVSYFNVCLEARYRHRWRASANPKPKIRNPKEIPKPELQQRSLARAREREGPVARLAPLARAPWLMRRAPGCRANCNDAREANLPES